jgi:hypothetical protein
MKEHLMANFRYQPSTTEHYAGAVANELREGHWVHTSFDPADGRITGLIGATPHTNLSDWLLDKIERRTSTV